MSPLGFPFLQSHNALIPVSDLRADDLRVNRVSLSSMFSSAVLNFNSYVKHSGPMELQMTDPMSWSLTIGAKNCRGNRVFNTVGGCSKGAFHQLKRGWDTLSTSFA